MYLTVCFFSWCFDVDLGFYGCCGSWNNVDELRTNWPEVRVWLHLSWCSWDRRVCQEEGAGQSPRSSLALAGWWSNGCCVSECKSLQISDIQDSAPLSYMQHLEDSVATALRWEAHSRNRAFAVGHFCWLWLADKISAGCAFPLKEQGAQFVPTSVYADVCVKWDDVCESFLKL